MPATATNSKKAGDISNAFRSLSGILQDAEPLDDRYRILKEHLLRGSDGETISRKRWQSSWNELLLRIKNKADDIEEQGSYYIPTIEFDNIRSNSYQWHQVMRDSPMQKFKDLYRERGVAVIRNVIPVQEALDLKEDLKGYIHKNNDKVKGFPDGPNKQVYEIYWSKTQLLARSHPRMLLTHQFLLSFWHAQRPGMQQDDKVIGGLPEIAALPVTYADRLRMRQPGDSTFALGPHVDGGSVERWEPQGYGLADSGKGTYQSIFSGQWQEHDPWFWPGRIGAESDVHKGIGACSMFRAAQGWLALSEIGKGEGHLMVNPLLREALAYWLMRPFFESVKSVDEVGFRKFLEPENWRLEETITSKVHGATPGFGQEINKILHPHLRLDKTMIHMPKVQPGDFVVWHCDTIHAVDAKHEGATDSSVLYIPVCPWTQENLHYTQKQLKTFIAGAPSPDFGGGQGEHGFIDQIKLEDTRNLIGKAGQYSMGILNDKIYSPPAEHGTQLYKQILKEANDTRTIDFTKWP